MISIESNGSVLLGRQFCCDAHSPRAVRIVTHAHWDHVLGLEDSLKSCQVIYMTAATKELIQVLRGPLPEGKVRVLEYDRPVRVGEEVLTLLPSDHILGSCQVRVRDGEGNTLTYTGDFRLPRTPVPETEELVIEATYGNPRNRRAFGQRVEEEAEGLVRRMLASGPVYIFGYHGKLQEFIGILRQRDIDAPVLMPKKVYEVSKVCERFGMKLGEFLLAESEEGKEIRKGGRFIGAYSMGFGRFIGGRVTRIYLSGWEFERPVRQVSLNEYVVAFSDHADFDGLMEYVRLSKPRYVITDNFRVGDAPSLAREIKKRFGIRAQPMPK